MITVDVKNLEGLAKFSENFTNLGDNIMEVVADELIEYGKILRNDPEVPREYSNAIYITIVKEYNLVAMGIHIPKRKAFERFGNRKQWAVYKCKRRKYFGGTLTKEYDGLHFIVTKWDKYKSTFIDRVKTRIAKLLKGEL